METFTPANTPFPPGNGTADTSSNKAALSAHKAVDKMAGAADDAARTVKPAIERVAKIAHHAVDQVVDVAVPTADWLSKQGENLKATQRQVTDDAAHYVSANPWKSVGFALAAGILIGRVMR